MKIESIRPSAVRKPEPGKAAQSAPAEGNISARAREKLDRLELSREAVEKLNEERKARQAELESVRKQAEAAREQAEAMKDAFDVFLRCLKIAGRIINGDKVPAQDEEYLLENDPKMYQMAMSARIPKEDPKEWDSLLEDEEEENSIPGAAPAQGGDSGGGEAPVTEAAPVEGGAEVPV